jgi:hypothetical protein
MMQMLSFQCIQKPSVCNGTPSPFIIMETGDNSAGWPSELKKHFKLPLPDTQHHECPSPKIPQPRSNPSVKAMIFTSCSAEAQRQI